MLNMTDVKPLATFFFSHGSPRTLVDETDTTRFAQKIGEYARAQGVTGIVWMAAHWETHENKIEISSSPRPGKDIVSFVPPEMLKWYEEYQINSSPALAERCHEKLKDAGFNVSLNEEAIWHQDVMIPIRWMYPDFRESPPMTIISVNGRFDPWFHLQVGLALRALRHDKILLIGTGGGVHNLYTVSWHRMLLYQDTLTRTRPVDPDLAGFGASMRECVVKNAGPHMGRALARLLAHPHFLQCNPSPEHFLPMVYAAGGCSTWEDADGEEYVNVFGGENWEMDTQLNVNFAFGLQKEDTIFSAFREQERNATVSRLVESVH
ncbi:aromatic ring-opening dioxygenase family protein [Artomyces pyxidatus]|uniref:Aromatic ring-opening dioxygenase family protein n=1 Tax=Artomyces pyxidatus TaxID=48021 RepID=A0ACB8SWH5_9AGAM|nr:aromatic ring-opening dioxygenase family protein [Artomyces pyxidatus]